MRSNTTQHRYRLPRSIASLLLVAAAADMAPAQQGYPSNPPSRSLSNSASAILSSGGGGSVAAGNPESGSGGPLTGLDWTAASDSRIAANADLNSVTTPARGHPVDSAVIASGAPSAQVDASDGLRRLGAGNRIPLAPPSQKSAADEVRSSGGALQMLFSIGSSLILVVGLFLAIAWCYRRTLSSSLGGGVPKQVVHILGRTPLSARQQMVLVRFGNKLLLVSVIQGEARTLSEITNPLEVDHLVGLCESSQPESITNSFKNILLQEGSR